MRRGVVCALFVVVCGCGGPPPPPTPTGPRTYAAMAPSEVTPLGELRPTKHLQVAFDGEALPATAAVEAALATASHIVSVGESSAGMDVALSGSVCEVSVGPRLTNLPDPAIAPELDKHGLGEADGRALFGSRAVAHIKCRPAPDSPAYAGASAAEIMALALIRATGGYLYDPHLDRFWPTEEWEGLARRGFSVARNVRVIREKGGDGRFWLGTRGMSAVGRADLEVFPVAPDAVGGLEVKLLTIADAVVNDARVGAGSLLDLGSTKVLCLDRDAYAATWPKGTTGAAVRAPGDTSGRLALTDPKGRPGDRAAAERLARRLSLE